jgi:hypothetical protein
LEGTHPETTPARFGLIWFSGFIGEDLYVIFCQNMPNLHNRYISAERNISQKNLEYMLNYSLPCSCSQLEWRAGLSDPILKGTHPGFGLIWKEAIQGPFHQTLVAIGPVVSEEKIKM